jgi:2-dehydro-3-deoxygluconokinase
MYGCLTEPPIEDALEVAVAYGALAMTTPRDTSIVTLSKVRRLAAREPARVVR